MRKLTATVFGLFLIAAVEAPAASQSWLTDAELKSAFSGRSISGEYKDNSAFHEAYASDGAVAYRDGRRTSAGHWSIRAGSLCTIYDADLRGGCFRVLRAGENCFEFHFVARTESEAESGQRKPDWTAHGWYPGHARTCAGAKSV